MARLQTDCTSRLGGLQTDDGTGSGTETGDYDSQSGTGYGTTEMFRTRLAKLCKAKVKQRK